MLDNRTVFQTYVMPAALDIFRHRVNLFNAASMGALVLNGDAFQGDFRTRAFINDVVNARRRVDRYGPNTEAPLTHITDYTQTEVKIAGGFGPVVYEPSEMTWLQEPTAAGVAIAAQGFADALLLDQINTALGALVGALSDQPDTVYGKEDQLLTYNTVNFAHARFGAQSGALMVDIMSGLQYHAFIDQNLKNEKVLFESTSVRVVSILGKVVIVVDAPNLTDPVDGLSRVLSLTPGAAVVSDPGDVITNVETRNGKQRIETTFQADYTYNLALKGFSWDDATGGKSPADSEILSGYNWKRVAKTIQSIAGVMAIGKVL